jgi:hypothetical protein
VCEECNECDLDTHFRSAACTETEQTVCQALTICGTEQFQTRASSLTQDRQCQNATQCVVGQEVVNLLTATSDRSCQACPAGKTDADNNSATACVSCGAGHYVLQGSIGSCTSLECAAGYTDADSDATTACEACDGTTEYTSSAGQAGACTTMRVCNAGEEMALEGTSTSDRVCQPCTAGSFSSDGQPCVEWTECIEYEQELTVPSASQDRSCECQVSR